MRSWIQRSQPTSAATGEQDRRGWTQRSGRRPWARRRRASATSSTASGAASSAPVGRREGPQRGQDAAGAEPSSPGGEQRAGGEQQEGGLGEAGEEEEGDRREDEIEEGAVGDLRRQVARHQAVEDRQRGGEGDGVDHQGGDRGVPSEDRHEQVDDTGEEGEEGVAGVVAAVPAEREVLVPEGVVALPRPDPREQPGVVGGEQLEVVAADRGDRDEGDRRPADEPQRGAQAEDEEQRLGEPRGAERDRNRVSRPTTCGRVEGLEPVAEDADVAGEHRPGQPRVGERPRHRQVHGGEDDDHVVEVADPVAEGAERGGADEEGEVGPEEPGDREQPRVSPRGASPGSRGRGRGRRGG